jgi:hypothetical protein
MIRRRIGMVIRIVVGGIFVYAGAMKAINPAAFADEISRYHPTGPALTAGVALYLPWLELIAGTCYAGGRLIAGARAVLWALLLMFLAVLAAGWWRGVDPTCGCFGGAHPLSYAWMISRDVLLAAGLFTGLFLDDSADAHITEAIIAIQR